MTESDEETPGPPPLMELARQLISERTRPREYHPRGYDKTEIPRDICSAKTLGRLESGRYRGVKLGTVLALANFYRTPPPLTDHMANLVKAARANDWCREYASALDDNGWFYQQCEDNASYLAFHSFSLIPSLIQGPAYYRLIRGTTKVNIGEDPDWDGRLEFRMERRERWIESERPALVIMGEATLTLDLGPEKAEIIADLRKIAAMPFADVRVIPFSAGLYELQRWGLNLMEYDGGEETVIHVESPRGSGFVSADSTRGKFFTGGLKVASGHSIELEDFLK
ncbi:Scr1 family TA system antitoxin-like transcriptional regulator [Glycomyces paridis]|uniref:Helix-turn-helix domain-containing protein n=1 Tax=Glycomyces paridis TaxID=2126555 RepID=A0A4S8P528_9ACTN|nr:Scr1 family TA system antitoxin-like transcriptional regulator [Glycomyces paridis]THV24481.1 helix-turn-helix domain-containing protein [Glycomyces paridis]